MKIDHLIQKISETYEILEHVDMADISDDPTVGYKIFQKGYRESFAPNQRFLFFCNGHAGRKSLSYLKHAADIFDVSRCFILVCASSHDADTDGLELQIHAVDSREFNDDKIISTETLCALPWFHLEYMNQGKIHPCCFNTLSSENEAYISTQSFFWSDKMQQLRQQLKAGEKPPSCAVCWKNESNGLDSLRQWRNKSHRDDFFTRYLSAPTLESLVIRPSTVCNFKCRICNSGNSSQWLQEEYNHETDASVKTKLFELIERSKWFDNDSRYEQDLLDLLPRLKFIDIYGGEPLLIKQFKKILDMCVSSGMSKDQTLHFNTNCSVFPQDLISKMSKFKKVAISLSIDDIGSRFEMTRGGDWTEVNSNIERFLACDPQVFTISALVTVSNLNLLYLDQLTDWLQNKNIPYSFNMLHSPEYLKFDRVTDRTRQLAINKYLNHPNTELAKLAAALVSTSGTDVTKWINKIREMDQRRGQDISSTHPELCDSMGYVRNH